MEDLNKRTYVVIKNYGMPVSTWTNENEMLAFVLGGVRNNMTKTLNQQVIKSALKLNGQYRKIIGKIVIEIHVTISDGVVEKLTRLVKELKEKEIAKKESKNEPVKKGKKETTKKE